MTKANDEHILDLLKQFDEDLQSYIVRCKKFDELKTVLEKRTECLSEELLEKVLAVCATGLEPDYKYTTSALEVLGATLQKVQTPTDSLSHSATTVLNILILTTKLEALIAIQSLCVKTLLLYPEATLSDIVTITSATNLFDVINVFSCKPIRSETKHMMYQLLIKFLNSADTCKRTLLLSAALNWLPNVLNCESLGDIEFINTLDVVVEALVEVDYEDHPQWIVVLDQICNQEKYPHAMKKLLVAKNVCWYRLWSILIKLLKTQVTKVNGNSGPSPINSMLPVVEMAFKMDTNIRCQAFLCWKALIDNFALELNESYIIKRLKLLVIPLKSTNAKVAETAIAKFHTWWYLIMKFRERIDNYIDIIVIPFLYFCFGKSSNPNRNVLVPGQLSITVKELGFDALVNMMGSSDKKSNSKKNEDCKLISTKALVSHWADWIHALKIATKTAAELILAKIGETKNIVDLWKSFALTIAELPNNNVRRDIFDQLLSTFRELTLSCKVVPKLDTVLCSVMFESLFSVRIQELYGKSDNTLQILLSALLDLISKVNGAVPQTDMITSKNLSNLRNLINVKYPELLDKAIDWVMNHETPNDASLFLWLSLFSSSKITDFSWKTMIVWPVKNMSNFSDKYYMDVLFSWRTVYAMNSSKSIECNQELINILIPRVTEENNHLCLNLTVGVILSILRIKVLDEAIEFESELDLLLCYLKKVTNYKSLQAASPLLIDVMVLIIEKVVKGIFVDPESLVKILKIVLKWMARISTVNDNDQMAIVAFLEKLINSFSSLFTMKTYTHLHNEIIDELIECSCSLKLVMVVPVLKTFLALNNENNPQRSKIESAIQKLINKDFDIVQKGDSVPKPNTEDSAKSLKTPTILKVVEEDGEEFVVVKSNWKFNPRKLTENQKERLKRKREDIPALYQDLSQSQDEFKLKSWKSDSQDTTLSKSTSTSNFNNDDVSTILKSIPGTNVVPKIMENIKSESANKSDGNETSRPTTPTVKDAEIKNTKSPRLALKERVFRNVKSLIEKNMPNVTSNANANPVADMNKSICSNDLKTPSKPIKPPENVTNSAPPKILSERPSRTIKKPKKFDDTEIVPLKKKRSNSNAIENSETVQEQSKRDTNDSINNNNNKPTDNSPKTGETASHESSSKSSDSEICTTNDSQSVINITDSSQINSCVDENVKSVVIININSTEPKIIETANMCEVSSQSLIPENHIEKEIEPAMSNNDLKTPKKTVKQLDNVTNSAPPIISTDRPSSTLKKPKQLNDTKIDPLNKKQFNSTALAPENIETVQVQSKKEANSIINNNNTNLTHNTPKDEKFASNKHLSKSKDVEKYPKNVINITDSSQKNSVADQIKTDTVENSTTNNSANPQIDETANACDIISSQSESPERNSKKITEKDSELSTPKSKQTETNDSKSSVKKKRSRIEKQLLIDMVEGHPLLQAPTVEKRITRKGQTTPTSIDNRRKNLFEKLCKFKVDLDIPVSEIKTKNKSKSSFKSSISVSDSQESQSVEDMPMSEDVIESSQDSTMTTISVKSTKPALKKPIVKLDKIPVIPINQVKPPIDNLKGEVITLSDTENDTKADIELSKNKTMEEEKNTENMDTEPFDVKNITGSCDVILINDDEDFPVVISTEEEIEIAGADTQPMGTDTIPGTVENITVITNASKNNTIDSTKEIEEVLTTSDDDITKTLPEISLTDTGENACSPLKDETQKKKDFLNDTIEISPIKTLSPLREDKSPSPEPSSNYVVIKLTSPVQSNGEPLEKCESPEIFTEDKNSPEKRDQSPPRAPVIVNNISPSSSLSSKKRPQVRSGRAAQMLGLCAPDKLEAILNSGRLESEVPKNTVTTPARRNLRILYNTAAENKDAETESDDGENYLKLKRSLPTADCSPSGPILKRKLAEIADETTFSPASKRKRVSFHDPPVSTTVAVQKYIEPYGIRSPQNSALKRQERLSRTQMTMKSPKRLDNVFKLDTALTKTVESFSDETTLLSMDEGMSSFDQTPAAEVVKTTDLNDVDPICPELLSCTDPIANIAGKLSSPATQELFIKEIEGKIQTIADLARMTELEVNRLCINAPKVKVAKKVLADYASKKTSEIQSAEAKIDEHPKTQVEPVPEKCCVEVQTNVISSCDAQIETVATRVVYTHTQTEIIKKVCNGSQTDESDRSTEEVISSCLADRPDFVDKLRDLLDESAVRRIAEKLPYGPCTEVLISKMNSSNSTDIVNRISDNQKFKSPSKPNTKKLDVLQEYMASRFDSKDLILFCSQLLKKIHDKPA